MRLHFRNLPALAAFSLVIAGGVLALTETAGAKVFSADDVERVQRPRQAVISPDGAWIAYTIRVEREATDEAGSYYSELYLVSTKTGEIRPFITGKVKISDLEFSPDGEFLAYRAKREDNKYTQVWMIPVTGGESIQVTDSPVSVSAYHWHPSGAKIAYIAQTPPSAREKTLKKKGYEFTYFEEDLKNRNLYMIDVTPGGGGESEQITTHINVWTFEFGPEGRWIAAGASSRNLIDERYAFNRVHLVDVETHEVAPLTENEGKLGNFAFSPDGTMLAYAAALNQNDHAVSQAYVMALDTRATTNLTPDGFEGHVEWVAWKDKKTVLYYSGEGMWSTLSTVKASGGERKVILHGRETGINFTTPYFTKDFEHFALRGASATDPGQVYYWRPGKEMKQLTNLNPWLAERELGRQEIVRYPARDGLEIEGVLVYPVGYEEGKRCPMIVGVHGGPESHYLNWWLTSYFMPAQALAGNGYAVFYPNYRGSTGRGLAFTKGHFGDPAGKEFDDVADGIDYLVERGIVDGERVGLGGGSYGGFAAAWFATYYTEKVRAVSMFVGISNLISKRGTTDIPYEELFVHSGTELENMWQKSLERSPIYHAHQSKTATLIIGGDSDTRVHPSQSMELFRRMKMNDHPAVRLVQYPGEGHGNAKQTGRIDVLHRNIQWFNWYVMEKKPLDGPMPPLDISDTYGIELPEPTEPVEAAEEEPSALD